MRKQSSILSFFSSPSKNNAGATSKPSTAPAPSSQGSKPTTPIKSTRSPLKTSSYFSPKPQPQSQSQFQSQLQHQTQFQSQSPSSSLRRLRKMITDDDDDDDDSIMTGNETPRIASSSSLSQTASTAPANTLFGDDDNGDNDEDLLRDLPLNELFSDSSNGVEALADSNPKKLTTNEKLDTFRALDMKDEMDIENDADVKKSVSKPATLTTPQKKKMRRASNDDDDEDYKPDENIDDIIDDDEIDESDLVPEEIPLNATTTSTTSNTTPRKRKFADNFFNTEKRKELHKEVSTVDKYEFLKDIRDANQRRPGEPGYDPTTLYIPQRDWIKLTAFDRQFWEVKCKHFDTVVFFRKGKFYELYEGDADIGQRELGLRLTARQGMRMVGVPITTLMDWSGKLLSKGYKVARVDEMEAGDNSILRRELTRIYTPGTLIEETLLGNPAAVYLLAFAELDHTSAPYACSDSDNGSPSSAAHLSTGVRYGVCLIDCASGEISVGEFDDDKHRTAFETLLVQRRPREVLVAKAPDERAPSAMSAALLRSVVPGADIMRRTGGDQFWDHGKTLAMLRGRSGYEDADRWPTALLELRASGANLALSALGAAVEYLGELKLDEHVLSLRNFVRLGGRGTATGSGTMVLDGQTLRNLDVLECAATGRADGSLFAVLDHTRTAFGKRLLARWLCSPLLNIDRINARLDAVDVLNGPGAETAALLRTALSDLPDLERKLARINDLAVAAVSPAIFVETLCGFAKWFKVLVEKLQPAFVPSGDEEDDDGGSAGSALLASLVSIADGNGCGTGCAGQHPDLSGFLEKVGGMLDYDASFAYKEVVPLKLTQEEIESIEAAGEEVDEDLCASIQYTQHFATIKQLGKKMDVALQRYRKLLRNDKLQWGEPFTASSSGAASGNGNGGDSDDGNGDAMHLKKKKKSGSTEGKISKAKKRQIEAFGGRDYLADKRLLLEVPAKSAHSPNIPGDWKLLTENKQRSVFWTPVAEEVGAILAETEDAIRSYEQDLTRRLVAMFTAQANDWAQAVQCIAQLDCLQSLAAASAALSAPSCRPQLVRSEDPVLEIEDMRHPCLCNRISNFVPNSVTLCGNSNGDGVETSPVMLLTGPNMGGKSTLLRQTCVCVIMAQLGCYVPAESCRLSPVDRIFTRIGANDNIVAGQSTFMVELQETSSVLTHATKSVNIKWYCL